MAKYVLQRAWFGRRHPSALPGYHEAGTVVELPDQLPGGKAIPQDLFLTPEEDRERIPEVNTVIPPQNLHRAPSADGSGPSAEDIADTMSLQAMQAAERKHGVSDRLDADKQPPKGKRPSDTEV